LAGTDEAKMAIRQRLNILILHETGDLWQLRRSSFNHSFCLLKYAPWNSYTLQSFRQPIPGRLRRERFDAIILDTTFLCWRWSSPREDNFDRLLKDYAFVADSDAVKIALPQDEYDHSAVLDDWLTDWRADLIYSVCYEHREVFYPKAAAHAEIVEGMTGYLDEADIAMTRRLARPFEARDIDIGYRAKSLPPYFGRFGRLKAEVGERFRASYTGKGLSLDISVDPRHALMGDDWLRFLGNCRFTLGCESGSSLLDPVGEINRACRAYLAKNPNADFEEVEAVCFPNQDMRRIYSAISPRIFEAALTGTCQVLSPGHYGGILSPGDHFIPWDIDARETDALYAELSDWRRAKERVEACATALLGNERLTYRGFVNGLLDWIEARLKGRKRSLNRQMEEIEAPNSSAELMHQLAEAAVRMVIAGREDLAELADPGAPIPVIAEWERKVEEPAPGISRICLLALSTIVDDPRVRRQGELFASAGWDVIAVGLPGGRSPLPDWPILGKPAIPSATAAPERPISRASSRAAPCPAVGAGKGPGLLAAAHFEIVLRRKRVSARLAAVPRLRRLLFLVWRGVRFAVLVPLWTAYTVRLHVRNRVATAKRIVSRELNRRQLRWWLLLSRLLSERGRLWKAVAYRRRVLQIRFRPDIAEEIFWNELAISRDLRSIYETARDCKADIWLANDWTALPLAALLAREKGGAYVYDTHEFAIEEYAEKPKWRRWSRPIVRALEGKYIRDASVVSAVSAGIARRLDRVYRLPRPTIVVRNTPQYERRGFRPTGERIRVLYHGIIVPGRGLEIAIDSVAQWRREFELTLRGPDNPEFTPSLRARIAAHGLDGRVVLAPAVPMTELVQEASAFDIGFFALPGHSRHNEFALPNKIFEYIMAGLCLCTTELPEIAGLIREYDLGVTISTPDPAAIAVAINSLDRDRIDDYKRNALIAARELCWERESEKLLAGYAACLRQPGLAISA
jgi:glycosyltransferase involved in cell wall biosynthesis